MPVSRITFALGDLVEEVRRLCPPDAVSDIRIVLDAEAYAVVGREVAHHSNVRMFDPDKSPSFKFAGATVMREDRDKMRKTLELIAGKSTDKLHALQAAAALDNIGPSND